MSCAVCFTDSTLPVFRRPSLLYPCHSFVPPPPPVLEPSKHLLPSPPLLPSIMSESDFLSLYDAKLAELTFNSKPLINSLTMIADESKHYHAAITRAIVKRIQMVRDEQRARGQGTAGGNLDAAGWYNARMGS